VRSIEPDCTPLGLMHRACAADFGIVLGLMPASSAHDLRRSLYSERERQRRLGVRDFDGLSFLVRTPTTRDPGHQLWIVKREKVRGGRAQFGWPQRPLTLEEMPFRIGARGPKRSPLTSILRNYL
jgi:hypothetical protein